MSPRAFTLIELLVVITIIVVLLALLTPALDQAIYQAELAVCGSSLRTIAVGATGYAAGNRQFYPNRDWVVPENFGPEQLAGPDGARTRSFDSRPALSAFIAINATLNDVMAPGRVDIARPPPSDMVMTGWYQLWIGYQYQGDRAMRRLGDRWTFTEQGVTNGFSVLASDTLQADPPVSGGTAYSSHPSRGGEMAGQVFDNQTYADVYGATPTGTSSSALTLNQRYTFSRWIGPWTTTSVFDNNYAYADGSVTRLGAVKFIDSRMVGVGVWSQKVFQPTWRNYLPYEPGN